LGLGCRQHLIFIKFACLGEDYECSNPAARQGISDTGEVLGILNRDPPSLPFTFSYDDLRALKVLACLPSAKNHQEICLATLNAGPDWFQVQTSRVEVRAKQRLPRAHELI